MVEEKEVGQASSHPWVANGQGQVRFGIVGGPMGDWPTLRDFVQMVEGLGLDSYWRPDRPLLTPDRWTTLAAVAASMQRLRLGTWQRPGSPQLATPPDEIGGRALLAVRRVAEEVDADRSVRWFGQSPHEAARHPQPHGAPAGTGRLIHASSRRRPRGRFAASR